MAESLLLTATPIKTFLQNQHLTNASGFFFENKSHLFLVTSRHVLFDDPSNHVPDRIEIEIHTDPINLADSIGFSILLYNYGKSVWRQGTDSAGEIDVAVVEIERNNLPENSVYCSFTPDHLLESLDEIQVGSSMLIVGFPLGFHDSLHHLPIVRHAVNASSLELRFKGSGYFLTDARTHRGTSGASVVIKSDNPNDDLPWKLLGVHSARLDVDNREVGLDEALGLNCAWFADILLTLTQ